MLSFIHRIELHSIIFLLFISPPSFLFAGGIASIEQIGEANSTTLIQDDFENEGIVTQSGDNNSAQITQNNPADDSKNQAIVNQGSLEACTGCIATVTQTGSNNFGQLIQDGERNEANLIQDSGGSGNFSLVEQLGNDNQATFNQEGDNNTALSSQTGNENAFEINQLNSDNFIEVIQSGGAGSGPGGPTTLTQTGGGNITIIQGP